jgi:hypothetical protein
VSRSAASRGPRPSKGEPLTTRTFDSAQPLDADRVRISDHAVEKFRCRTNTSKDAYATP